MKEVIIITAMSLLLFGFLNLNLIAREEESNARFIVGYDLARLLIINCGFGEHPGFWGGAKVSVISPNGKKYNWSQDRAETFYDSEFLGYSRDIYLGLGCGLSYSLFVNHVIIYAGIGYLNANRYREYYDSTFTTWSNYYYIEDGKINKGIFDKMAGLYLLFQGVLVGFGYSWGTSSFSIHLGFSLE